MRAPTVVSDTSPLQYLHQLGLGDLLPRLFGQVLVPQAVVQELEAGRAAGVSLPDVRACPWIRVEALPSAELLGLASDLGPGERETIALSLQQGRVTVLLDDRLARRYAALLDVPVSGTLGVLVAAKQRGLLMEVAPVVDQLSALGFRLAPSLRAAVLRLCEE